MRIKNIFFAIAIIASAFTSCNTEVKKENVDVIINKTENTNVVDSKKLAINISGMTCEIGCAKTIESKLSKQDGVLDAKVIYTDSIANITYDPAKTNKAALMSFVGGIADNMYTVSEADSKKCCDKGEKKSCDKEKKSCDKSKKQACSSKDSKECSTKKCAEACKSSEKSCSTACVSDCCV